MTQEEKARAYDEALEVMRQWVAPCHTEKQLETMKKSVFPQLAESEDERIRKFIVGFFASYKIGDVATKLNGVRIDDILAYLEKQKYDRMQPIYDNQESFESALDKAWKSYNDSGARTVDGCEDNYTECAYAKGFREGYLFGLEKKKESENVSASTMIPSCWEVKQKEQKPSIFPPGFGEVRWNPISSVRQKPSEWTLPKDFEEAVYKVANFISPFDNQEELRKVSHHFAEQLLSLAKKELDEPAEWGKTTINGEPIPTENQSIDIPLAEWSEEDKETLACAISVFEDFAECKNVSVPPASAKRYLKRLKSLRPQPKQEWSEEDELMRTAVIQTLERFGGRGTTGMQIDWLKSLRPSWKPSEQEKGALKTAISILTEERSFPKAAGHLQAILDAFDGKESRKDWKPSEEQMKALDIYRKVPLKYSIDREMLDSLYEQLKKL